jgi:hypothetical protein
VKFAFENGIPSDFGCNVVDDNINVSFTFEDAEKLLANVPAFKEDVCFCHHHHQLHYEVT